MRPLKNQIVPIERLTREPNHHFFGYYDIQPFSEDLNYHLCHRVKFMNRMQSENDVAELGMIRLYDNEFIKFAETTVWNFQQGSLMQWHPLYPNSKVIYNVNYQEVFEAGTFRTVIQDIHTGEKKVLPMALATIDPNGRFGLAVNFSRIYGFRKGYGYAGLEDKWEDEGHPTDDGVWRVDLVTGEAKLVLSLDDMYKLSEPYMQTENEKSWKYLVNHINLNTDGSRFLVLFRGRPNVRQSRWVTYTITCGSDGSDPYLLLEDTASHLHWRDPEHVMIYAKTYKEHKWGLYLFTDKCHEVFKYDSKDTMPGDGHCSFSPDRKYILNDTYPDKDGYRSLFLYDIEKDKRILLAKILTIPHNQLAHIDMRCDLHPRWSKDGSMISFDSVHEGHRHVYRIRMEDLDGIL